MVLLGTKLIGNVQNLKNIYQYFVRRGVRRLARSEIMNRGVGRIIQSAKTLDHSDSQQFLCEVERGIWMILDLSSLVERDIYYKGFYRPWVWKELRQVLISGQTVFDVGANIGCYSLFSAKVVENNGKIFAFEPDPNCFTKLVENLKYNSYANIEVIRAAVSDVNETKVLHINSSENENQAQSSLVKLLNHKRVAPVECITLDRFVADRSLERIDVIKIDTQGAELRVLSGASEILNRFSPTILFRIHDEKCRAMGDSSAAVINYLLDFGYLIKEIHYRKQPRMITSGETVADATYIAQKPIS